MQRTNDEKSLSANEDRLRHLFVEALAGDSQTYHTFLREISAYLRGFLRKRVAHLPDEVEDLVQEVLLAVHNQRHTYDANQPLTAWVHAIAKYKLIDLLRRRSHREMFTDSIDDVENVLFCADNDVTEVKRDLEKLLGQLPDRQRLPIIHTKLEGQSVADTAQMTGMSESAVKVGVHRGLKALGLLIRRQP